METKLGRPTTEGKALDKNLHITVSQELFDDVYNQSIKEKKTISTFLRDVIKYYFKNILEDK